jgi:hypothetical protein
MGEHDPGEGTNGKATTWEGHDFSRASIRDQTCGFSR